MTESLQPNERLLKIMEARELREAEKFAIDQAERAEKEKNHAYRVGSQKQADAQYWISLTDWQRRCDHRKGTSGKKKWRHVDNHVGRHIFQNGTVQIKCFKCRFKWYPGDTKEVCSFFLDNYMKGKNRVKFENPTGMSYEEAYTMTLDENTTNTETRSEVVVQVPSPVTV
jgi:hypothetical protein